MRAYRHIGTQRPFSVIQFFQIGGPLSVLMTNDKAYQFQVKEEKEDQGIF